jgi:hypothetical protein
MGIIRKVIDLSDTEYFCNKSWTISFNINTKSWVSFHSYLPNWYIGENNFFYSGLNGCCDEFDFVAFSMLPIPPTTTTTTTPYIITTTTTTRFTGCDFTGNIRSTDCSIDGNGFIIVPPVCVRPDDLNDYTFITGYKKIPSEEFVDSTLSQAICCAAQAYTNSFPEDADDTPLPFEYTGISVNAVDIAIGSKVYSGIVETDCTTIPNGWYYTEELADINAVFNVLNGIITEIEYCVPPTTTTTTTGSALTCSTFTASKITAGVATFTYIDCTGLTVTQSVGQPSGGVSTITFCASSVTSFSTGITITYNGPC